MAFPAGAPGPQDWLRAYAKIQRAADAEVMALLRRSLSDINRSIAAAEAFGKAGVGEAVRIEQMRRIRAAMLREQAELFRKVGDVIAARRSEAAARASSLGSLIDSLALGAGGRDIEGKLLADALLRGLDQTIEVAVTRMTQSAIGLSERIYRTRVWMDGRVEKMINSALARGLTVRDFAAEAQGWFNPNVPGGARYASLRLARSEINNAYHAISVNQAAEKPWVDGMKWNLSRSHPKPDQCDVYATEDGFQMGPGVFPPRDVPRKPHPHCLCTVTPVLPDEDEFLANLTGGRYDDYLARKQAAIGQPGRGGRMDSGDAAPSGALPGLPGSPGLDPNRARREAARARQRTIQEREGIANLAADTDAAIGRNLGNNPLGSIRTALDQHSTVARANGLPAIPQDMEQSLRRALASGADAKKMRTLIEGRAKRDGLSAISPRAGARGRFDPDIMETFSGAALRRGQPVDVLRRGYHLNLDGEDIHLFKAKVRAADTAIRPEVVKARAHAKRVNRVSPGPAQLKTRTGRELAKQADIAPHSMLQLDGVFGATEASAAGRAFIAQEGINTGAYYTYGSSVHRLKEIHLSPRWNSRDKLIRDSMDRDFSTVATGGWHVPSGRPGLPSTVAHEFGHHIDRMITRGTGNFGLSEADELMPALQKLLNVRTAPKRNSFGGVGWSEFDDWVKANKTAIQIRVSRYAAHNARELLAEIWSEFSTSGKKARPGIVEVGRILQRLAEAEAQIP